MNKFLDLFSVCFCIEESPSLLRLLGAPSQKPPLLLWRDPGVAFISTLPALLVFLHPSVDSVLVFCTEHFRSGPEGPELEG